MEKAQSFRDLLIWQRSHQFTLNVYSLTRAFPKSELFGLTSQMRRSAVSISANIVESFRRPSAKEKARFLDISLTSLDETWYYLILSKDLGYQENHELESEIEEISKMISAYRNKILN